MGNFELSIPYDWGGRGKSSNPNEEHNREGRLHPPSSTTPLSHTYPIPYSLVFIGGRGKIYIHVCKFSTTIQHLFVLTFLHEKYGIPFMREALSHERDMTVSQAVQVGEP